MPRFKATLLILGITTLPGCGTFAPVGKLDDFTADQRKSIESVPVLEQSQLAGRKFRVESSLEGISCKNKIWDPSATQSAAITQLKYWARQKGADAITNLQCEQPQGASLSYNCWQSVKCTAEAIRFE